MKKLILMSALLSLALVTTASAAIGWAGNVWPNNGANVVPTGPLDVYGQCWKSGVTDMAGQGMDIEAYLDVTTDLGGPTLISMTYLGDVGSNDEYTGQIGQTLLVGASWVSVNVKFHDLSDDTWYDLIPDQTGAPGPQVYNVTDVLPVDIDVTFTMCMSGEPFTDGPCVVGSAAEINSWGSGVAMTSLGGDLYEVTVTFLAGGNPSFEYKYQKDGCSAWESVGNRLVTLPTDGTTAVGLAADSWNNLPMACGMGNTFTEDKTVCFQVCLDGVETLGDVCVVGNIPALDNWGTGVTMTMVGPGLYQACIVFPIGSAAGFNVEYKYKKDGCATWEGTANHMVWMDDASPTEQTLTHNWEDGPGACAPVGNEDATFSTLKSLYR